MKFRAIARHGLLDLFNMCRVFVSLLAMAIKSGLHRSACVKFQSI